MSPIRSLFIPRLFALVAVGLLSSCGVPSPEEDARVCADVECGAGRCVSDDGAPVCHCSAWEQAAGLACVITAYRPPDDHGDARETATALAPSADFHEGTIHPPFRAKADQDVFAMPTLVGHGFRFILRSATLTTVAVRLLDPSGKVVASQSVTPAAAGILEFISTEAAPRFITVAAPEGSEASGTYTYRLEDLGRDAHGDTLATATQLEPANAPFPVSLEFVGDEDVFTFRTEPGHGFQFSCESSRATLSLMDGGGVVLKSETLGVVSVPRVGHVSPDTSTWFVRVSTSGSTLLSTQCQLEDLGGDEHSNERQGATPLTAGVPVTARLQGTNDVDVFSFFATAGQLYDLWLPSERLWRVRLTDPDGQTLVEARWHRILHEAASTGMYTVHVLQDSAWGSDFQVRVDALGADDHGGTPETATRVELGETVTGLIHKSTDLDAIAVPLEADGVYRLTCTPDCEMTSSAPGSSVYLHKVQNGVWGVNLRGASGLATFIISSRSLYDFTFRMERVGTDDHGDDADHATPLSIPATVAGVFELGSDIDVFSIPLEAGQGYVATYSVALQIRDPNGTRVPVVFDMATRTWGFTAPSSGTYGVAIMPTETFLNRAASWRFTLNTR